jgi:protein-L-isoaspartate O-methyltransferase
MTAFARAREKMVERQIAARGISDPRILEAFRAVPREEFVPAHLTEFAYEDGPLPIEADQTISQPYIVALMAEPRSWSLGDRVLEGRGGIGIRGRDLCPGAGEVLAIERLASLPSLPGRGWERLRLHQRGHVGRRRDRGAA